MSVHTGTTTGSILIAAAGYTAGCVLLVLATRTFARAEYHRASCRPLETNQRRARVAYACATVAQGIAATTMGADAIWVIRAQPNLTAWHLILIASAFGAFLVGMGFAEFGSVLRHANRTITPQGSIESGEQA